MKTKTPGRPVVFLGSLALAVGLGLTLYAQDNLKNLARYYLKPLRVSRQQ